ncbi:MAG: DUF1801 domain-containing protein [Fimbriimonadaceae bacterium]|nr:DUF1801 domain-containing protein [Fimbriimonadaceae bacterium]
MPGNTAVKTAEEYIEGLEEPRKSEIERIHRLIQELAPGLNPHIRSGMIGYGTYHYKYDSGREGDWFRFGLASNKNYISVYVCAGNENGYIAEQYKDRQPKASIGRAAFGSRSSGTSTKTPSGR